MIGSLLRTRAGWAVRAPAVCPAGHPLGPRQVLVGHQPCSCGGHTTWTCRECDAAHYWPPALPACVMLSGPAAVR